MKFTYCTFCKAAKLIMAKISPLFIDAKSAFVSRAKWKNAGAAHKFNVLITGGRGDNKLYINNQELHNCPS
jgi:hypothetical protein